jgi:hypothetical protein
VPNEHRCAVPGRVSDPGKLHQRIRQLAEQLRTHDVDEGYEWPCSEPCEEEQPSDSESA